MSAKQLQDIISPKFTEAVLIDIVVKYSELQDVQLGKIEIVGFSKKGDSYLSDICRFTVEASGKNSKGNEDKVHVPVLTKYLPKNLARRKTFRSTEFFENEAIFYEKVWSAFKKFQDSAEIREKFDNIPLLLSLWIDGTNDYIALVDLTPEGYKSAHRGPGLDYAHTVLILRLLARFHALSLAFKDQQPQLFEAAASSLKETYFSEKLRSWYTPFQERLFIIARDAVQKELPPPYLNKLNNLIADDLYGVLTKSCKVRGPLSVVQHGDVWVPNFLIQYKDGEPRNIKIIDFQLTRYTTLTGDLTFFLFSCAHVDLIEERWDDLIQEYYGALVTALESFGSSKSLVTLQALNDEIKANAAFAVGMSIEALTMSLLEDSDVSDLDAIPGTSAVPLESVWIVHPFKEKEKRERIARMIKCAADKKFI